MASWIRLDGDFFSNDEMVDVTVTIRYATIAILSYVKDYGASGSVKASIKQIAAVKLISEESVAAALRLTLFVVDGKMIQVVNWHRFQIDPTAAERQSRCRARHSDVTDEIVSHGSHVYGTGRDGTDNTPIVPTGDEEVIPKIPKGEDNHFDEFWKAYPKKVGKGAAIRAWKKIRPGAELRATMIAAVVKQKVSDQWRKERGQYIPHPATWLNQMRWEDEPTSTVMAGGVPKRICDGCKQPTNPSLVYREGNMLYCSKCYQTVMEAKQREKT